MTEEEQRQAVIKEALTWENTPFLWEGTIKGVGIDCGRFLACVFKNAGVKDIDIKSLPHLTPNWFMHNADESFLNIVRLFATDYDLLPGQIPRPADIIVVKHGRDWAHSAIVLDWPKVIGAAYGFRVTTWKNVYLSPQFGHRPLKFLDPWKVKEVEK